MPDKETMEHIANLFKGFADPTRVHILSLLQQKEELFRLMQNAEC